MSTPAVTRDRELAREGPEAFVVTGRLPRGARAWGEASLDIELLGQGFRFRGLSSRHEDQLTQRYGGLRGPASDRVTVVVQRAHLREFRAIETSGWTNHFHLSHHHDRVEIFGLEFAGRILLGASGPESATLWLANREGSRWLDGFENFFRTLLSYRLLFRGGLLLHSVGLVVEERALLFVGPSGAGKSTLAGRALAAHDDISGSAVLSDDINAVAPASSGYRAVGLPFAGEHPPPAPLRGATVELGGLFRLRWSNEGSRVTDSSRSQMRASLVACAPFVNGDPLRFERLLAVIEELTASCSHGEFLHDLGDSDFAASLPRWLRRQGRSSARRAS